MTDNTRHLSELPHAVGGAVDRICQLQADLDEVINLHKNCHPVMRKLREERDAEMEHRQQLQDELNVAWMDTKVERKRRERAESALEGEYDLAVKAMSERDKLKQEGGDTMCLDCGHKHAGKKLGGICIGCPCPNYGEPEGGRERAMEDEIEDVPVSSIEDWSTYAGALRTALRKMREENARLRAELAEAKQIAVANKGAALIFKEERDEARAEVERLRKESGCIYAKHCIIHWERCDIARYKADKVIERQRGELELLRDMETTARGQEFGRTRMAGKLVALDAYRGKEKEATSE